jgi:hypothetical protein
MLFDFFTVRKEPFFPGFKIGVNLGDIQITDDKRNSSLKMISLTLEDARAAALDMRSGPGPVAYKVFCEKLLLFYLEKTMAPRVRRSSR